ncbi:YdcF family protein [Thermosipho ferrireducens]|uniref:YdcF family protein n=1 Tax=Thermosipho ferrireducens TaxID=2571116 RepID=A0ABX7S9Q9_9BACT|nr:YdcF family protein [Thermosipho ferrireducens]QTA38605.1 YdcF family protein [Thermosipho ferrireducens]
MVIYKALGAFFQFPGLIILLFLTLYLINIKKRRIRRFFLLLVVLFYLTSTSFFVYLVSKTLKIDYVDYKEYRQYDSLEGSIIVILGGGIISYDNEIEVGAHTLKRIVKGYEIYRETNAPILVTGGVISKGIPESHVMKEQLIKFGVPADKIIVEDKARNTFENAKFSEDYLKNFDTIYLVTSFLHMKRSLMQFSKALKDKRLLPVVCDFPIDFRGNYLDFLPSSQAFYSFSLITHEWIGLVAYSLGIVGG